MRDVLRRLAAAGTPFLALSGSEVLTRMEIWRHSKPINEVRSIHARDLPVCSTCTHVGSGTRCPGLAYMEGNLRGPSALDCEMSFARTGILSANMLAKKPSPEHLPLVQITSFPQ